MIEVLEPSSLRREMKGWSRELYNLYKNDWKWQTLQL
jgi:hypothetical protein